MTVGGGHNRQHPRTSSGSAIRTSPSRSPATRDPKVAALDGLAAEPASADCARSSPAPPPSWPVNTSSFDYVTRRNRFLATVGQPRQEDIPRRIRRKALDDLGAVFIRTH